LLQAPAPIGNPKRARLVLIVIVVLLVIAGLVVWGLTR
jgi:hypothetical protein